MLNDTRVLTTAVFAALLICTAPRATADGHNALEDPSFEIQTPPREGGWRLFEQSIFSKDKARSGSQSMFNGGMSRTVAYQPFFVGMVSGSYQELPAEPGSRWRLTGYGMTPVGLEGTPAFGIVQVSFFDADGKDLGTVETVDSDAAKAKTSNEVNNQTAAGEWVLLDTGVATAPEGTVVIHAFTLYVDYSGSNAAQGVYFDDLALCELDGDGASCEYP